MRCNRTIKEPTYEQVENKELVYQDGDEVGYACWYPQMGGYCGKCVVVFSVTEGFCFGVYVWHDGDFPFGDGWRPPIHLHHCCPDQFVEFGKFVRGLQDAHGVTYQS